MIEYGVVYKEKMALRSAKMWHFYIFLNRDRVIFYDERFAESNTNRGQKLDWTLLDDDDFEKYNPNENEKKLIVEGLFKTLEQWY